MVPPRPVPPRAAPRRVVLVLVAAAVACWAGAVAAVFAGPGEGFIDLVVYRAGGRAWATGVALYGPQFPDLVTPRPLPFTYPPISAVLFAPLAAVPLPVAAAALTAASLAALAGLLLLVARRLEPDPARAALLAGSVVVLGTLSEPVRETLTFGQVNLLLAGLVAADCLLVRTRWPRGALIGLAAAVKLTPAVFVLYFVARRQWRPALVAAAAFGVATGIGFLAAPRSSVGYWFGVLGDPDRIGSAAFASNQSLAGLLRRLGALPPAGTVLWAVLSAVVVLVALVAVHRLRGRADDVGALLVVAAAGLLCSPVSWSHHWVWAAPAVLWAAHRAWGAASWRRWALVVTAGAVFAVGPHWLVSDRDDDIPRWGLAEQLVGNAYLWCALAVLLGALAAGLRTRVTGTPPAPARGHVAWPRSGRHRAVIVERPQVAGSVD